jgi:hypothetical protein
LTFPQLLWNQCPHMAHCVPDFNTLSHPQHKTCRQFPASTPGPGFCSTPPITNRTAKVAAHRSMFPIVHIDFPLLTRPWTGRQAVLAAQESTWAR